MRIVIKALGIEKLFEALFVLVVSLGGLFLILDNLDYSSAGKFSAGPDSAEKSEQEDDEWKLISAEDTFYNATYLKMKSLQHSGNIVSFWKKQLFNKPDPIFPDEKPVIPEASKRTGMPIYEAQEFYEVDCQRKMTRGPLLGVYWKKEGGQAINPKTRQGYWRFPAQWVSSETFWPNLQYDVCRYNQFQSSNSASQKASATGRPFYDASKVI